MTAYYDPIIYDVPPEDEGILLKTVLNKRMGISRKLLSRLKLTEKGIMLNGIRVYIDVKVRAGDRVEIRMEQEISEDILPEPLPFDVLYEDAHLLIVNKVAGMIVHPTHGHYTGTLANAVVYYWQSKGQSFRFRPVHRLDQDTSGVLAIAKNPYAHQHISEQMIAGTVDKRYIAYVHGSPEPPVGRVDGPIDRDPANLHKRIVTPDGYPALTLYTLEESWPEGSRISLKLETGRTHQIRVHMTHIGCPLIGDPMYFADLPDEKEGTAERSRREFLDRLISRQALHAAELSFDHPLSGERCTFRAPLPPDLLRLEEALRTVT
ncbi:RluA family pseudouridine synthase [Paenibacillus sp. P96]|uniref:Pseudouridine synthase n=1 Tax=Paenibacillus zeirhizosphaerae TaxID=2987519 RepID=A0ABT9FLB1_9BACL|nr:RluA family pseudouridine synthase [Paenibacillus sp. P96]MDP4095505.1 RluA family pseudouridine synthase [Paenibacillus sp. P96]